jgi:hypothetical protein
MARTNIRRAAPKYDNHVPAVWVQTSGDVDKDARWIVCMAQRKHRLHELWRLEFFHGPRHRAAVEAKVLQLWPQRFEIIAAANIVSMDELMEILKGIA